jgi:hypothetical protein
MHKHILRLTMILAIAAALAVALSGPASAAAKDSYTGGLCYSNGWCQWSVACYDAFGGCFYDFWCPVNASSTGQCVYYGGFAPYASTATSTASDGSSDDYVTGTWQEPGTTGDYVGSTNGCYGSCIDVGASGGQDAVGDLIGMNNQLVRSSLGSRTFAFIFGD